MQLGPGVQYNTPYRRDGIIPEKTHQLFVEHVEGVQHSLYLQSLNYVMLSMRPHPATTMLPTYGEMPPHIRNICAIHRRQHGGTSQKENS